MNIIILVIIIPLLSSIVSGLGGRKIGETGATIITTGSIIIASIISWTVFFNYINDPRPIYIHLWNWIESGSLQINMGLQFDSITMIMLTLVTTVSALVHLYSIEYMRGDPHVARFMSYLSLFTFFMIILVTADNYLQLFIGWEGVGLCSYLLINFWYTRIQANKSAMKAMIVNRVGDVGVVLAMFLMYIVFGSLDFSVVNALVYKVLEHKIIILNFELQTISLISLFLLIGAIGKSAQIGLHTWLPDAMEGPTPVSALIHAATMVTAGVFLLIRSSPILEFAPNILFLIVLIGSITALFAATIGLVQHDIKKVIAYSTCSQLGYMVFACGLSNYSVSLFHLFNHGFFKALLFLSAGVVIHGMADEQDMRKLGGLIKSLPFTYSMMFIGSLSLMGFPFLTGFYSKDAILEHSFASFSIDSTFAHWLGTIAAFFTAFYSFRLLYYTFLSSPNASQKILKSSHESGFFMSFPLLFLAIASIFIGFIFRDLFIGFGSSFFGPSIFILPSHSSSLFDAEFLPPLIKGLPVILSILSAILAISIYSLFQSSLFFIKWNLQTLYLFLINKWHFDLLFNSFLVLPLLSFGHQISYKIFDRGWFELIGPFGISSSIHYLSSFSKSFHSGLIYHYAFTIFLFITLFLFFLGSSSFNPLFFVLLSSLFVI